MLHGARLFSFPACRNQVHPAPVLPEDRADPMRCQQRGNTKELSQAGFHRSELQLPGGQRRKPKVHQQFSCKHCFSCSGAHPCAWQGCLRGFVSLCTAPRVPRVGQHVMKAATMCWLWESCPVVNPCPHEHGQHGGSGPAVCPCSFHAMDDTKCATSPTLTFPLLAESSPQDRKLGTGRFTKKVISTSFLPFLPAKSVGAGRLRQHTLAGCVWTRCRAALSFPKKLSCVF